jgi:predicted nucleotidyltransferase
MLRDYDLALLRDFLRVVGGRGTRCTLIGAGARVLLLDEPHGLRGARATRDWDFAVEVESREEYEHLRDDLLSTEGRFRSTGIEHRLLHADGGQLDLVPCGGIESPREVVTFPNGNRLSVRHLADPRLGRVTVEVQSGLRVEIASIPSLALLKLDAYMDRRSEGVTKDIEDLYWILNNYEDAVDAGRIYEQAAEFLQADVIVIDDAGAYLLGLDLLRTHGLDSLAVTSTLLMEARGRYSRIVTHICGSGAVRGHGHDDDAVRAQICRKLSAFELGLGLRQA